MSSARWRLDELLLELVPERYDELSELLAEVVSEAYNDGIDDEQRHD